MPPTPTPHFVITHPEVLFAVLETGLNGPAHSTQPHQRRQRGIRWRVAQVGLQFPCQRVASQDQPDLRAGQAFPHGDDPQRRKARHQRPFASLLNRATHPAVCGQQCRQLPHLCGCGFPRQHTEARRFASPARPGGHRRGGTLRPDLRVVRHFRQVPQTNARNGVEQAGVAPKGFVTRHPTRPQCAGMMDRLYQLPPQRRLGLEGGVRGDPTAPTPLGICLVLHSCGK